LSLQVDPQRILNTRAVFSVVIAALFSGAKSRWGVLIVSMLAVQAIRGDGRQLIWTGWDVPTPAEFRTNVAGFDKLKLFDGSSIVPTRQLTNGTFARVSECFTNSHWVWSEFEQVVNDLKSARPLKCTNNFLMLSANPGSVDWFDDAGWAEVTDHWRLLARVARQGGLAGLLFDPEPYRKPWSQFLYTAQASKTNHSFIEMQAKARQRGRDVMKAIAGEYPAMTIFFYRMFSDLLRFQDRQGANLQTHHFGLLPAFIDGWCDAMPGTITLIDGNEVAYHYQKADQYAVAFARLKKQASRFVSPENRSRFARQLAISHGVYLDARLPASPIAFDLQGMSPAANLFAFTSAAFDFTDGFIWIYGEKGSFWPSQNKSQPPWTNKFQGIETALLAATEPAEFAQEAIANSQPKNNLLKDTAFDGDWFTWQESGSNGAAKLGLGFATLTQMKYGAVHQTLPVKPGQAYIVGVKVKQTGPGTAGLLINWKSNLKWVAQSDLAEFVAAASPDADGWRQIAGLVIVPAEANRLMFLCTAGGQDDDKCQAVFKDPVVIVAL
jgi:hypothetical protein